MHTVAYGVPSCVRGSVATAHTLINPYPLLPFLFFLKAEVNSSHPIIQEKPLNICFCCHGNWLLLSLLPDRQRERRKKRERERVRALFYRCRCILMRFDANWRAVTPAFQEHCRSQTSILSQTWTITSVFPTHRNTSYSPVPEGKRCPEVASVQHCTSKDHGNIDH